MDSCILTGICGDVKTPPPLPPFVEILEKMSGTGKAPLLVGASTCGNTYAAMLEGALRQE